MARRFLARITLPATESFESHPVATLPTDLHFGLETAVVVEAGLNSILDVPPEQPTANGEFPTSGSKLLELWSGPDAPQTSVFLSIAFANPMAAFGFIATDIEDNKLEIILLGLDGMRRTNQVPVQVPQGSGGACYFGIIDTDHPFVLVEIYNIGDSPDGIGFDDLTVARPEHILPAPYLYIDRPQMQVCWETVVTAAYQLQCRSTLTGNIWVPLGTGFFPGTGGIVCSNNISLPGEPQRYYRVAVTNLPALQGP